MAVKGRLRFEILRRDNHTCRYCGATSPDVKLTVDHVVPESLGGSDDPSNLVTACTSCNAGKASIAPDSAVVADVAADALRFSTALSAAMAERRNRFEEMREDTQWFYEKWTAWGHGEGDDRVTVPLAPEWRNSVERWLTGGLDVDELVEKIPNAMKRSVKGEDFGRWRYYCGIAWNMLTELQDRARELANLSGESVASPSRGGVEGDDYFRGYDDGFTHGRSMQDFRTHRGAYRVRVFDGLVAA